MTPGQARHNLLWRQLRICIHDRPIVKVLVAAIIAVRSGDVKKSVLPLFLSLKSSQPKTQQLRPITRYSDDN